MVEEIVQQQMRHATAVREFNERLKTGGSKFEFPIEPEEDLVYGDRYHSSETRRFVYVDGKHVRGGYILIGHGASREGDLIYPQFFRLPLSEGIVDRQYSILGALLVKDAISKDPLMYGLGGGGAGNPSMQMTRRLGFRLHSVPFRFRVLNAAHFFRNIQPLRTSATRGFALDAFSHIPLLPRVLTYFQAFKARPPLLTEGIRAEIVPAFGSWADDLWEKCRAAYSFIALRNAATLNWRLPPADARLHRIKLMRGDKLCGWVVVTDSQFQAHKQFGAMRVGAIVDALCLPSEEGVVMAAAVRYLRTRGVGLIVSNQCAALWNAALDRNGFLAASSNFIFAASPQLAALIGRSDPGFERVQMNRCDGDGPIHL